MNMYNITEIRVKRKPIYGKGAYNIVYDLVNHPDKVVKIPKISEEWKSTKEQLSIFSKYPFLFPKVYIVTDKYAILEKLDDKKALEESKSLLNKIKLLENKFKDNTVISHISYANDLSSGIQALKFAIRFKEITLSRYKEDKEKLMSYLSSNDVEIFINREKFIDTTMDIEGIGNSDIHDGQFAYDKNNNLKLIDF